MEYKIAYQRKRKERILNGKLIRMMKWMLKLWKKRQECD